MSSTRYRPDIDGLRFVAVVPVVLFHAEVPGFSGGFVGVDIFFVISGYLITSIIVRELLDREFSIAGFYERRIRRIFPALFAMVTFVCLISPATLLPSELRSLPIEVLSTVGFSANLLFWWQVDYFASAAEEKPLLHAWSLGVEEQFYIFAPVAFWIIIRYARRFLIPLILIALIISLAASAYVTPIHPKSAFYLLPFRAWELLVGSLLAVTSFGTVKRASKEYLSVLGLALIAASIFYFSSKTDFPGVAAIAPVAGAALIIAFGADSAVGHILANRHFVFIGLISYSLYLWHWPLIVFFRDLNILEGFYGKIAVVLLSFVAAWASWRYVETPFRNSAAWPRPRLFRLTTVASLFIVVVVAALHKVDGWPSRFDPEAVAFDNARNDVSPHRADCHISSGIRDFGTLCRLGVVGNDLPSTIVWSDSHGVELAAALAEAGLPVIEATYSACPPALQFEVKNRPQCKQHNQMIFDSLVKNGEIDTVIITAYYTFHSDPSFWNGLRESILGLEEAGKTVIVLGGAPYFDRDIPSYLASGGRRTLPTEDDPVELKDLQKDGTLASLKEQMCPGNVCPLVVSGRPVLFDNSHLSYTAARSIAPYLVDAVRSAALPAKVKLTPQSARHAQTR